MCNLGIQRGVGTPQYQLGDKYQSTGTYATTAILKMTGHAVHQYIVMRPFVIGRGGLRAVSFLERFGR